MMKQFHAIVTREGDWFVAQCLEVDVASQGCSSAEALTNLQKALELHFEEPRASVVAEPVAIEVTIGAAEAPAIP